MINRDDLTRFGRSGVFLVLAQNGGWYLELQDYSRDRRIIAGSFTNDADLLAGLPAYMAELKASNMIKKPVLDTGEPREASGLGVAV